MLASIFELLGDMDIAVKIAVDRSSKPVQRNEIAIHPSFQSVWTSTLARNTVFEPCVGEKGERGMVRPSEVVGVVTLVKSVQLATGH